MDRAPLGPYRRGEAGTYRTMSCGVWRVIPHPEWTGFFGGHPPHLAYDSLIGSYAGAETRELSIILPSHSEPGLEISAFRPFTAWMNSGRRTPKGFLSFFWLEQRTRFLRTTGFGYCL